LGVCRGEGGTDMGQLQAGPAIGGGGGGGRRGSSGGSSGSSSGGGGNVSAFRCDPFSS